jgi:hypothetical protein
VDTVDGSIGCYSVSWDEDMSFAEPTGILTGEQALSAYREAAGTKLCYVYVPSEATVSGEYNEELTLFTFSSENTTRVDAKTERRLKTKAGPKTEDPRRRVRALPKTIDR